MSRLLVFQHVAAEPLGTLDPLIRRRGHRIRFVNFERNPDAQPDVERYKGLVVLGGPMNVEDQARLHGLKKVFILTTQTAHWFAERGFLPASVDDLPAARRELYNHNRRSKVLIKPLQD